MSESSCNQVIVVGGGLAGFSAANSILENGGSVLLIDKSAFCGGNSSKATSGINGSCTRTQQKLGVKDSNELFEFDCMKGGSKSPELIKTMVEHSGPSVNWLMDNFDLDLSLLARMGGHSVERTHRGKERFPGMTITYAEMQMAESISNSLPDRCKIINKARGTELITNKEGDVIGVIYTTNDGESHKVYGPVILATGGYGADFSKDGLLAKYRPDLLKLSTTNGEHCTGDGIKMGVNAGADVVDLEWVQVHPTGLVNPKDPDSKVKFLAAEALRGVGGLLLDADGHRFANELGRRDYVSDKMFHNKGPFRLVLNTASSNEMRWHVEHYKGRGVMKEFNSANDLAKEMGIPASTLEQTFKEYKEVASKQEANPDGGEYDAYPTGKTYDQFGKKFFTNYDFKMDDHYNVAIVTPLVHYCMGGLKIDTTGRVISKETKKPIRGLYAAGEVMGGVHGNNRLGGNSLLDCVVYGRITGKDACKTFLPIRDHVPLKDLAVGRTEANRRAIVVGGGLAGFSACNTILENGGSVLLLDKSAFCGGNSSKATSGINGSCTKTQKRLGVKDSNELFEFDCMKGGSKNPELIKTMVEASGPSVNWLMDNFDLDLSLLARMGGHSVERTHRGKERFPGMTITYAEMQMAEAISKALPDRCQIMNKARVTDLITGDDGEVIGVRYTKDGKDHSEFGPVVLATGGFGADFSKDGLLAKYRPDLLKLSTTNGEHCTGDGIKMGVAIGAQAIDLEWVQVHPTGLVNPKDPDSKVKFLAAEALRGVGGLLLDADGHRFANELGRRDYVSDKMFHNKAPFRLVLNTASSNEMRWHVEHYKGRGVMKEFNSAYDLAKEMGIPASTLEQTFKEYKEVASKQEANPDGGEYDAYPTGKTYDQFGKKFFTNYDFKMDDHYNVAIVTPLVHYCMGGLKIDTSAHVIGKDDKPIRGLYAAGEVMGGVHGNNRLGGNSLLDCVAYGRICGKNLIDTFYPAARPVALKDLATGRTEPRKQAIVVGGGLAGFSAANSILERGGEVVLIDKSAFCGGNSSKATSGINGSCTKTQKRLGVKDSNELFEFDCMKGGSKNPQLIKTMVENSGPSVEWLMDNFDLDLSLLARMGGHSVERTHRGKERFPGMTITYAEMQMAESISKALPDRCKIMNKARATELVQNDDGDVIGVKYEKDGKTYTLEGPVILATGGYGADFSKDGLLAKYRPDLLKLSTTNGEHCTGDGIKMGVDAGADVVDLEWVQVHPTGLVNPKDPDSKVKFLAAEALRGVGGLLLDADGHRFANELGRRDYVSDKMFHNKGPFRLVLNTASSNEMRWHVEHYKGRGVMKEFNSAYDLAKEMGIPASTLEQTFKDYKEVASKQEANPDGGEYDAYPTGKTYDQFGKKFFKNYDFQMDDHYNVAIVTPLVHYCMGGLKIDEHAHVIGKNGKPIRGLYAAGELMGGVHGNNRLGGNSLLDCVVYGRISGNNLIDTFYSECHPVPLKDLAAARTEPRKRVIVVGGGLAGFSAANTVLEHSGEVLLVDKSAFCGGNSSKATSGINGSCTKTQEKLGVKDSNELFEFDCMKGGSKSPELIHTMVEHSGPSVNWLMETFGLDLSLLARMGGHSVERTHRGKERFPGMTITYAQMQMAESIAKAHPDRCQILNKARATELETDNDGNVIGVKYEKDGKSYVVDGPVILATGGYGADFSKDGLLAKYRPDLLKLSTTNGEHCTGDGIKMGVNAGADVVDLEWVQVHPTGLVNPKDPDSKVKFLAAEALRGVGGLLLDADGHRFANELGRRDYVSDKMFHNKGPFRLVLNTASSNEMRWHVEHYKGRGVMKEFNSANDLAKEMGIPASTLEQTFKEYKEVASKQEADPEGGEYDAYPTGKTYDQFGKKFFKNYDFQMDDHYNVAIVTPLVHYCMGGLKIDTSGRVISKETKKPIRGLYAAGEVMGGVHGNNRLGGNSLLDCVVFGRLTADDACENLLGLEKTISLPALAKAPAASTKAAAPAKAVAPAAPAAPVVHGYTKEEVAKHHTENDCWVIINGQVLNVTKFLPEHPGGKLAIMTFAGKDATKEFNMIHPSDVVEKYAPDAILGPVVDKATAAATGAAPAPAAPVAAAAPAAAGRKTYSMDEVAKHNSRDSCWVVIDGEVLDVTSFLPDHPGGDISILNYGGKDATEPFHDIHPAGIIQKYCPDAVIGVVGSTTSAPASAPAAAAAAPAAPATPGYTMDEVAKHNTEGDCWVAINGQVLNVTNFLPEHPGGKLAIMTFAGKDATKEFNMIHPPDVVEKYASHCILGPVVDKAAVAPAAPTAPATASAPPSAPVAVPAGRKTYSMDEIAGHNTRDSCWVVIDGEVLDVTSVLPDHPGGDISILNYGGKDASEPFHDIHPAGIIQKYCPDAVIGVVGSTTSAPASAPAAAAAAPAAPATPGYTMDEVAKHNTEGDCWVAINGQVLNVTNFLPEHPGGKLAIMTFAGKDATKEFNMIHPPDVVEKYASNCILGPVVERKAPAAAAAAAPAAPAAAPAAAAPKGITMDEAAKHNTESDCWVVVNGQVLNVTNFLPEHPGGKLAIMTFAGKDATKEFNMIHPPDVVEKYASDCILGPVVEGTSAPAAPAAPAAAPAPAPAATAAPAAAPAPAPAATVAPAAPVAAPAAATPSNGITMDEVAKHTTEDDCWIVINGEVLDVTDFLPKHPGGKMAILTFAGKDASKEFNMIHPAGVIEKYAPDATLGPLVEKTAGPAPAGGNLAQPLLADQFESKAISEQWWGDDRNRADMFGPFGPSVTSYFISLCYLIWMFVIDTLKTIFSIKNYKVLSDKSGLERSAIFMMVFVTIHALGNINLLVGDRNFEGYAYLLNHPCPWSTLFLPVEIYLLLAGLLHVVVATDRTFKFKTMNSSIRDLEMAITGAILLIFLIVHLIQFRFVSEAKAPQYWMRDNWLPCADDDTRCPIIHFKDLYKMAFQIFESFGWVCFYLVGVIAFFIHMKSGLSRIIMTNNNIPRKYKSTTQFWGSVMAWVLFLLYLTYPLFAYFNPVKDWAAYDAKQIRPEL